MQLKSEKKSNKVGHNTITSSRTGGRYYEDNFTSEDGNYVSQSADWQFRISILPTQDNLNKAATALEQYFKNNKQTPSFEVKCLFLNGNKEENQAVVHEWDPVFLTGNDRNQRGKEVCAYFGIKDKQSKDENNKAKFIKSPEEWKELMLGLWKALQDAGVKTGYTVTPSGDKAVPSQDGLLVPFSYTSFKPYKQRYKILNETHYKPIEGLDDPLEGMPEITWDDLTRHGINHETVKKEMRNRIEMTETHLSHMGKAIGDEIKRIQDLFLELDASHPVYSVNENIVQLKGEAKEQEIAHIKEDFQKPEVQEYLQSLNLGSIDINDCIDKAPTEMQKVYMGIMHAVHEEIAYNEIKHLFRNETLKDIAISSGILLTSTGIGAGIGALLGSFAFGIGAIPGAIIGGFFGGAIGLIAAGLQGIIRNRFSGGEYVTQEKAAAGAFSTVGSTMLGATIGSLIAPGPGTLAGAGVGFLVGAVGSWIVSLVSSPKEDEMPVIEEESILIENSPYVMNKMHPSPENVSDLTTTAASTKEANNAKALDPLRIDPADLKDDKDKEQSGGMKLS